jgi:hypothetical protein
MQSSAGNKPDGGVEEDRHGERRLEMQEKRYNFREY